MYLSLGIHLFHAGALLKGLSLLGLGIAEEQRHSVLHVGFGVDAGPCPIENAQSLEPEAALLWLRDGSSWAVLVCDACGSEPLHTWLMRLRHDPASAHAAVIVLLDDALGSQAVDALRAGADVVIGRQAHPQLVLAQLARLRQRVAPSPMGTLHLHAHAMLEAHTRQLSVLGLSKVLQPQLFRLLWTLASQPDRVVSTGTLRVALDIPARAQDEALHTAVGRLRRLLRPHALADRVETVHGAGYRWLTEGTSTQ